jgi:hypothetical protein
MIVVVFKPVMTGETLKMPIYIRPYMNRQRLYLQVFFCRFVEKGNLEVLLFTLQSKMRANNQKPYFPSEGKLISDINNAWDKLEKAEHERELSLREELIRYHLL